MRRAGGIIGLVAGILGLIMGLITLFMGGLGAMFSAQSANDVAGAGLLGIFCAILVIILGAIAKGAQGRLPGILLTLVSIMGIMATGPVAWCMMLALVGGIMAIFGKKEMQLFVQTTG
jgi:hypothetical protein